jgi:transcriptional regulator with XRE-family HTH domain
MPNDVRRRAIAAEVRAALARHQKTQRDLAAVLGVAQPAAWARLAGNRSFRAEEIAAIAVWLDMPVAQLIRIEREAVAA